MLLTRLPLGIATPFDLHVLGVPPTFNLSHDQTLQFNFFDFRLKRVLSRLRHDAE